MAINNSYEIQFERNNLVWSCLHAGNLLKQLDFQIEIFQ